MKIFVFILAIIQYLASVLFAVVIVLFSLVFISSIAGVFTRAIHKAKQEGKSVVEGVWNEVSS